MGVGRDLFARTIAGALPVSTRKSGSCHCAGAPVPAPFTHAMGTTDMAGRLYTRDLGLVWGWDRSSGHFNLISRPRWVWFWLNRLKSRRTLRSGLAAAFLLSWSRCGSCCTLDLINLVPALPGRG